MSTVVRPGGPVRTLVDRHPGAVDVLLCAGLAAVAVLDLLLGAPDRRLVDGILALGLIAPLLLRRRHPELVFIAIGAVGVVQLAIGQPMWADLAPLVALYTVAATRPRARAAVAAGALEIGAVLVALRWGDGGNLISQVVFLTVMIYAPYGLGRSVQLRRAYTSSLEERAIQLEHERDQQGQLSAAAERTRIAREMHDVVAHNLSVMIALADGASFAVAADPGRATEAMQLASGTGRQALTEMRGLLGVLRDDGEPDNAPQPGIADLERLLDQVRAAGLPVRLEVSGPAASLSAGAQLTVFRIVQEALTNTLKYGGAAATAAVTLRSVDDGLELEISDTGAGARLGAVASTTGQGLRGMRERAAVYGGSVDAGPRAQGDGWLVRTRLTVSAVGEGGPS